MKITVYQTPNSLQPFLLVSEHVDGGHLVTVFWLTDRWSVGLLSRVEFLKAGHREVELNFVPPPDPLVYAVGQQVLDLARKKAASVKAQQAFGEAQHWENNAEDLLVRGLAKLLAQEGLDRTLAKDVLEGLIGERK